VAPEEATVVQAEELRGWFRREPFRPFRVHIADGRVFDIRHRFIHLVGREDFHIGVPTAEGPNAVAAYWILVPLEQVVRAEDVPYTQPVGS
jgi:hypothetical protein